MSGNMPDVICPGANHLRVEIFESSSVYKNISLARRIVGLTPSFVAVAYRSSRAMTVRVKFRRIRFEGARVRSIDVYFGAAYDNGVFVKQRSS